MCRGQWFQCRTTMTRMAQAIRTTRDRYFSSPTPAYAGSRGPVPSSDAAPPPVGGEGGWKGGGGEGEEGL